MRRFSRRAFLIGTGGVAVGLGLTRLGFRFDITAQEGAFKEYSYRGWEDIYRQKWTWDHVVRGAHHVINCASACPFNLFVKDGIVLREEQNAVMDAVNDSLPDFNPRGCQK
ncbi:MAG: hypothetical protein ACE5FA_13720, partial [Dehalococcoidia bacterium]